VSVMDEDADLDCISVYVNGCSAEGVPNKRFRLTDELVPMVDTVALCWPEDRAYFEGACREKGMSFTEAMREALIEWASH
jgi:hypothetical protein